METRELIGKLDDLIHLDVDALRAYEEAAERADDPEVRARLTEYRSDHQRHVRELRASITSLGGEASKEEPDARGALIEGMTALRSSVGTESALKAMRMNEKLTNRRYADAASWEAPEEVHAILEAGYGDEKRHLPYIEQHLSIEADASRR